MIDGATVALFAAGAIATCVAAWRAELGGRDEPCADDEVATPIFLARAHTVPERASVSARSNETASFGVASR